jgi:hypothetical protein
MASVVSLAVELDKTIYQALCLWAAKKDISPGQTIESLLRKSLAVEVSEVSGVPPLAALIQIHHTRVQETLKHQRLSALR